MFVQPKYGYAMFALKVFGSVQMSYFDTHHKKIWGVGQNDFYFSLRLNRLLCYIFVGPKRAELIIMSHRSVLKEFYALFYFTLK